MIRSPGVKDKTEAEKHSAEAKLREFLAKLSQQNTQGADAPTQAASKTDSDENK